MKEKRFIILYYFILSFSFSISPYASETGLLSSEQIMEDNSHNFVSEFQHLDTSIDTKPIKIDRFFVYNDTTPSKEISYSEYIGNNLYAGTLTLYALRYVNNKTYCTYRGTLFLRN